jgi:5-methyltetrahydropteroyltriglutamate--homocysteine methyltransferase
LKIIIPGIYPRSEELIQATRDYDRKRISFEELEAVRKDDTADFLKLQKGFKYKSTGLFNWQDLIRPFSEIIENCKVGGLVRFYETNTFTKALEFEDRPDINKERLDGWIKRYFLSENNTKNDTGILFSLPFLYLLKTFSGGISTDKIAGILIDIIPNLPLSDKSAICFIEPTFGFKKIEDDDIKEGISFLDNIKSKINCPVFINTFFFPIRDNKKFIFNLPTDGIGIDFYANSLSEIIDGFPSGRSLIAGIMNVNSTLIEERERILTSTEKLKDFIHQDNIYLSTNGPPELLPRIIMDEKVKNLQEII